MNQSSTMFKVFKLKSRFTVASFYANIVFSCLLALNLSIEGFKSPAPWKISGRIASIGLFLSFLFDGGCCFAMWWLGEPKIHNSLRHDLLAAVLIALLQTQDQNTWVLAALISYCVSGVAVYAFPYMGCFFAIYFYVFAVFSLLRSQWNYKSVLTVVSLALLLVNACMYPSLFGIVGWTGTRHLELEIPVHILVLHLALPLLSLRNN